MEKIINESSLKKLLTGLITLVYKKTAAEQEYEAIDRMTKQRAVMEKRSQYCLDLERTILEATLTLELLTTVENGIYTKDKNFGPEDIVMYYNGVFLDFTPFFSPVLKLVLSHF